MALTQVGSSTVVEATGTTTNLPVPASLATDDLVVACLKLFNTAITDTITVPTGFIEIPEAHVVQTSTDAVVDNMMFRCYYKWFAGEAGNYTFTWTHSNFNSAGCDVIRGAPRTVDPIDHTGVVTATTVNPTLNTAGQPSGTQTWSTSNGLQWPGEFVIAFLGNDNGWNVSTAGTMNLRQNTNDGPAVLDLLFANPGPTATQTISLNAGTATDSLWAAVPIVSTTAQMFNPGRMPAGV